MTLWAIWYHLYNSENVKNTPGGVLPFVKLLTIKSIVLKPLNNGGGGGGGG